MREREGNFVERKLLVSAVAFVELGQAHSSVIDAAYTNTRGDRVL